MPERVCRPTSDLSPLVNGQTEIFRSVGELHVMFPTMSTLGCEDVLAKLATVEAEVAPAANHPFLGQSITKFELHGQITCLADFEGAVFLEDVSFRGAIFKKGVSFIGTTFHGVADFTEAVFEGPAFFWKCTFLRRASFEKCNVRAQQHTDGRRFPGETNFSYCMFHEVADFTRMHCQGPSFFHRTIFLQRANFEECRFDDYVKFEGFKGDICLSTNELKDSHLIDLLKKGGVLIDNTDHPPGLGGVGFFNMNTRIKDAQALRTYLNEPEDKRWKTSKFDFVYHGKPTELNSDEFFTFDTKEAKKLCFSDNQKEVIGYLRQHYDRPMFASTDGRSNVIFVRTDFRAGALFAEVNLGFARFQQTSLKEVIFSSVEWSRLPLSWYSLLPESWNVGRRRALYDETQGITAPFLERTYHDLRMGYESRGAIDVARDFYYAEMELRYRAKGWLRRKLSLAFLFRYCSGFGRQQGLAGCLLLFLTVILFPLLWVLAAWFTPAIGKAHALLPRYHQMFSGSFVVFTRDLFWKEVLQSLEACTFITRAPGSYSDLERLVAGIERIAVAGQLTLFVLATKWQFERTPGNK